MVKLIKNHGFVLPGRMSAIIPDSDILDERKPANADDALGGNKLKLAFLCPCYISWVV